MSERIKPNERKILLCFGLVSSLTVTRGQSEVERVVGKDEAHRFFGLIAEWFVTVVDFLVGGVAVDEAVPEDSDTVDELVTGVLGATVTLVASAD